MIRNFACIAMYWPHGYVFVVKLSSLPFNIMLFVLCIMFLILSRKGIFRLSLSFAMSSVTCSCFVFSNALFYSYFDVSLTIFNIVCGIFHSSVVNMGVLYILSESRAPTIYTAFSLSHRNQIRRFELGI